MNTHIKIFDTTLRDGEQSPGATMNVNEKIRIFDLLQEMKVDISEAGFAAASQGDFDAIQHISRRADYTIPCSLARSTRQDIDTAAEALAPAERFRIHTFIATSPLHMKYKLRMDEEQVLEHIKSSVTHACKYTNDVQWSAEDATRSDINFLIKAVQTAVKAGATTINIPDTVGYIMPNEYTSIFNSLIKNVIDLDAITLSSHCHNDLGFAVANSIASLSSGVRQIEATINGIGERAGNAALEEVVMTLNTRKDYFGMQTRVDTTKIMELSNVIASTTGIIPQANKAIVGDNAFKHESGIHQHGVLSHTETYEIMSPESIGLNIDTIVLGKHSGKHALKHKLKAMDFDIETISFDCLYQNFKTLCDQQKTISDAELFNLAENAVLA